MTFDDLGAGEEGSRKKHKTADRNSEEAHVISDVAPKLDELTSNGGAKTERAEADGAMDVDEGKSSAKPNGSEAAEGEGPEGKQDLKKIEDEFTQLKEKFFAEKLANIKAEIEQIELGTSLSPPSPPYSPSTLPFTLLPPLFRPPSPFQGSTWTAPLPRNLAIPKPPKRLAKPNLRKPHRNASNN